MLWRFLVRIAGGFYEVGPWACCIHDHGIILAKAQVVQWKWPKRGRPVQSRAERMAEEDRLTRYR